jgi:AcrR family transcriptional regulator
VAPRPYSMAQRSQQVAQTRRRIVDNAAELFAERGARATTMTEVARRADVSPATVTNHFATQDELIEAVVERLMAEIRIPDASIFAGARSVAARIRALTTAMFEFYERTGRWYYLLGDEIREIPALATAEARFQRSMQDLYAQALAGTDDRDLALAASGLIHPGTHAALTEVGLGREEAAALVTESLTHWARRSRR